MNGSPQNHTFDVSRKEDMVRVESRKTSMSGTGASGGSTSTTSDFQSQSFRREREERRGTATNGVRHFDSIFTSKMAHDTAWSHSTIETDVLSREVHSSRTSGTSEIKRGTSETGTGSRTVYSDNRSWWKETKKNPGWFEARESSGGNQHTLAQNETEDLSWPGNGAPIDLYDDWSGWFRAGGRVLTDWSVVAVGSVWGLWNQQAGQLASQKADFYWKGAWLYDNGGEVMRFLVADLALGIGFALTDTGIGAVVGIPLMAIGVDQIITASANLASGQRSPSVVEFGVSSGARWAGYSEETSQRIGAFAPMVLIPTMALAGNGLVMAGRAWSAAAAEGGAAGRGLFGMKAPAPSGPISPALREQMLATASSPWFRFKANLWARLTGRGPINWAQFMERLQAAEFREFASWGQAGRSFGWAGPAAKGSSQWLFGVPRIGRNIPFVGRSLMQHELFHALQDLQYGLFAMNEASIPFYRGLLIEGAAHLYGGPLIGSIPFTVGTGAGGLFLYELYVVGDAVRITFGW